MVSLVMGPPEKNRTYRGQAEERGRPNALFYNICGRPHTNLAQVSGTMSEDLNLLKKNRRFGPSKIYKKIKVFLV
jgi:hypothetical protein